MVGADAPDSVITTLPPKHALAEGFDYCVLFTAGDVFEMRTIHVAISLPSNPPLNPFAMIAGLLALSLKWWKHAYCALKHDSLAPCLAIFIKEVKSLTALSPILAMVAASLTLTEVTTTAL